MDLAIRFPTLGRIHLESRFLFSEPHEPHCRQFLERVFQAPEITQVTIRSQAGSSEVPGGAGLLPEDIHAQAGRRAGDGILEPRANLARTGLITAMATARMGQMASTVIPRLVSSPVPMVMLTRHDDGPSSARPSEHRGCDDHLGHAGT